ncbi:YkyA family protein [Neobacillus sp. D3-1R]|uniref:YkyA family protein n=1 Tax=Neobacillus sp. D3-1R TaxID=3445778 RepID=UPI003FA08FF3
MNKKKLGLAILFFSIFLISGCLNQRTAPEKMYDVMEKVVVAENAFKEQQDPLVQAEKKEKALYDQIISIGMKEHDKIEQLSNEAISLVDERKKLMNLETDSIEKSEQVFKELTPYIKELKDNSLKTDAKNLYELMMERYKLHDQLQVAYFQALQYDMELYQLFKNRDVSIDQIEEQLNKINMKYEDVYKINEQFNIQTEKYNELKLAFYKKAGFKIEGE